MFKGLGYIVFVILLWYSLVIFMANLLVDNVYYILSIRLIVFTIFFTSLYVFTRLYLNVKPPLMKGIGYGLEITFTLLLPLYVSTIAAIFFRGSGWFYESTKPGFIVSWDPFVAFLAVAGWIVTSLYLSYILIATPYELFSIIHRKWGRLLGVFSSSITFTLIYNAPLYTGEWILEDIVFFGILFAYAYSIHRSILALAIAYLVSEAPMWWCILAPLGESAMNMYAFMRFFISIVSLIILIYSKYK